METYNFEYKKCSPLGMVVLNHLESKAKTPSIAFFLFNFKKWVFFTINYFTILCMRISYLYMKGGDRISL
jgi:hypothetical protein